MAYLSLSEKSQTIRYALLTTSVAEILYDVSRKAELTEKKKGILGRGADLIQEIINGAMFVEKGQQGHALPTEEGLSMYGYALSTLQALNEIGHVQGFTEYFQNLHSRIEKVIAGKSDAKDVDSMKQFFVELSIAFREDIQKDRYIEPTTTWTTLRRAMEHAARLS